MKTRPGVCQSRGALRRYFSRPIICRPASCPRPRKVTVSLPRRGRHRWKLERLSGGVKNANDLRAELGTQVSRRAEALRAKR